MPEEKPLILQYADMIAAGKWKSFTETQDARTIADNLEDLCNAALLSKNAGQAVEFLHALYSETTEALQPEQYALLKQTLERAETVAERGGWSAVETDAEETEPEIKPAFPRDVFPPAIERYCDSVANNVQVDRAMICAAVLSACALCMQGRFMVSYPAQNGHKEHLCLYIVIVACPGERKSSTFAKALVPVRLWQKERREQYKLDLAEYKMQKEICAGSIEAKKRQLQDKKTTDEQRQQLADELTALSMEMEDKKPPVSPEILATDTTVEALSGLMALTGETAGIFTDEADFLKIIAGLYNKGAAGNLQLVLCAYDGTPFFRVRGAGTISLERPLLSMCLFAQPALFEEIQENDDLKGRGMVGRLLFCTPEKQAGKRNVKSSQPMDKDAERQYVEILQNLLDMEQKDDETMPVILWEPDAAEYMLNYLQKLEDSMKDGNPMEEQSDYASKAGGVALRIAGILHVLFTGGSGKSISFDTAKRAVEIHKYFFAEKLKEMQQEETRENKLMERVLDKIKAETIQKGRAFVPVRSVHQKLRCTKGLNRKEAFEDFLQMLQAKNMIQIETEKNRKSVIFVSPYLEA